MVARGDLGVELRPEKVPAIQAQLVDMARAFDQTFDYLVEVKESRGIFNTNLYWNVTRDVLDHTGRFPVRYDIDTRLRNRVIELESRTVSINFLPSRCRFLHNRPRFAESYLLQAYLKLFAEADQELLIANAYFVPTPAILAGLKAAARRCVAVTLITNSPETNDLPEISMVGRGHYKDLLEVNQTAEVRSCPAQAGGIRIWEWIGRADDDPQQQGTMHSKFAVADRRLSLVGSYNLDFRSERLNSETGLVFEQVTLGHELARLFENDLRYSRLVSEDDAAEYDDPSNVLYRFRKELAEFFEEEL
jgi:phosphatidylserine/phosphatidylglycerophosphate/cardiolipin synthase-like enzyme